MAEFCFYRTSEIKNIERDELICQRVKDHLQEICNIYPQDNIVLIALQGSQNYELDTELSDVDTKVILTPNIDTLVFNKQPVSTTHIRKNNEHIDCTDIRLYFQSFKKQNVNFIEILYSPWIIINTIYKEELTELIENKRLISNYNPYKAVMTMYGIACNKFNALEKTGGSRNEIVQKYGYDGKQLCHLLRIEEFLRRYINGDPYEECLIPKNKEILFNAKMNVYSLEIARTIAANSMQKVAQMKEDFLQSHQEVIDQHNEDFLNKIQKNIVIKSLQIELDKKKKL